MCNLWNTNYEITRPMYNTIQARVQDFLKGGPGGTAKGRGVIAPVGEKLLFEHTTFSATRRGGGVITPKIGIGPTLKLKNGNDGRTYRSRCLPVVQTW